MYLYFTIAFTVFWIVWFGACLYSNLWLDMFRPLTAHETAVFSELQHAFTVGIPTQDWGSFIIVGTCKVEVNARLRYELHKLKRQEDQKKPQLELEALREEVDKFLSKELIGLKENKLCGK